MQTGDNGTAKVYMTLLPLSPVEFTGRTFPYCHRLLCHNFGMAAADSAMI